MTAGTVTPYRPSLEAGRDGFAQLLHAEWTKFRTVRGWVIGMAVAAAVMILLGLFGGGNAGIRCGPGRTGGACLPRFPVGPDGEAVNDNFYFVHRPMAGNGTITVRVTSLTGRYGGGVGPAVAGGPLSGMHRGIQPWSKAGIIITGSTRPGSAYAAMMVTGRHGVRMQYDYTHDRAGLPGAVSAASPRWLRLARTGDTITGYDSADGRHWAEVGTAHLAGLPAAVQAGPFATSPPYVRLSTVFGGERGQVGPSLATAALDHVSLAGRWPSGGWAGAVIGNASPYGPATSTIETFHQAGGGFTVTGSGDIAPLVNGDAGPGPITTIEQHLVGTFAGLIAVAVIAAMFMTTEYRRGLIRTTFAASPRRPRVLAAKAVVIGTVTFVTGLAAALVLVVAGPRLSRGQGQYVLPVPWLTEVRVVAGTAALLAVAAVLALAAGTVLRRSAAAVTTVLVAIVLPYILAVATVLPLGAANWLLRLTPAAAFAIQQSIPQYSQVTNLYTPGGGYFPLPPLAGFAVLCGYAALALGLAAVLLRRRDA